MPRSTADKPCAAGLFYLLLVASAPPLLWACALEFGFFLPEQFGDVGSRVRFQLFQDEGSDLFGYLLLLG